jgi:hypothetical protein
MPMPSAIYSAAAITVVAASLVMMAGHGRSPARPPVEVGETEYEVLSACLTDIFTGPRHEERVGKDIVKIIVVNMTKSDEQDHPWLDGNGQPIPWEETAKSLQEKAPSLQRTTIDAFREVNAQQASLRPSFHMVINYELLDLNQLYSIPWGGDWWGMYYKRFPGSQGIMTLSRVGFSADGTQALFYFSNRCGGLCGGGSYVVMEKRDSHWVIGKEIEMWVS